MGWDWVTATAASHGVAPLVDRQLAPNSPARIRQLAEQAARRNLGLAAELVAILDLLAVKGIDALPFKGPTLAILAYGDLGLRTFRDLDILVRPSAVRRALDLLGARGYSVPKPPAADMWHNRLARADGAIVELHTAFAPPQFPFPPSADEVWARCQPVRLGGRLVHTLGREDLLLYLVGHGAKHGWQRLAWIVDVAELLRRTPDIDWDAVCARARAGGALRMLSLGLLLAKDLLDAPVPPPLTRQASADATATALASVVRSRLFTRPMDAEDPWKARLFEWRVRERWQDRARYAIGVVATPNTADWQIVRLPRWLSFGYYLIRPVRLAAKYARRAIRHLATRR